MIQHWPACKLAANPQQFPIPTRHKQVVLVPIEFSFANDSFLLEREKEKHAKYAPLLLALRARRWTTHGLDESGSLTAAGDKILTIAVGHTGVVLDSTKNEQLDPPRPFDYSCAVPLQQA